MDTHYSNSPIKSSQDHFCKVFQLNALQKKGSVHRDSKRLKGIKLLSDPAEAEGKVATNWKGIKQQDGKDGPEIKAVIYLS